MVIVAVALTMLVGMTALAIDIGQLYVAKQRAQNVCDASALAGMVYLTGDPECTASDKAPALTALSFAEANDAFGKMKVCIPGTDKGGVAVMFPEGTVTDDAGNAHTVKHGEAIRTSGFVKVDYGFARIFGPAFANVNATATAIMTGMTSTGSDLIVPFAVAQTTIFGDPATGYPKMEFGEPFGPSTKLCLHFGQWQDGFIGPGNFGLLQLTDNAGRDLRGLFTGDPTVHSDVSLSINEPVETTTLPGNKVGSVSQGVIDRLRQEADQRFASPSQDMQLDANGQPVLNASGEVISPAWTAWTNSKDPVTGLLPFTWRLCVVPVIQEPAVTAGGQQPATIVGFAGFFIETVYQKEGDVVIMGRFVQGIQVGDTIQWFFNADQSPSTPQIIKSVRLIS